MTIGQQLYERVKIDKTDPAVYCEIEQSKGGIAIRKLRYQNEELIDVLGIKTEEERKEYNLALMKKAKTFTDEELEGHYLYVPGNMSEENLQYRAGAEAYDRRVEMIRTIPSRMIATRWEILHYRWLEKRIQRLHKKILKEAWAATEHMTDDELEQAVYEGECWFEEMMIKK